MHGNSDKSKAYNYFFEYPANQKKWHFWQLHRAAVPSCTLFSGHSFFIIITATIEVDETNLLFFLYSSALSHLYVMRRSCGLSWVKIATNSSPVGWNSKQNNSCEQKTRATKLRSLFDSLDNKHMAWEYGKRGHVVIPMVKAKMRARHLSSREFLLFCQVLPLHHPPRLPPLGLRCDTYFLPEWRFFVVVSSQGFKVLSRELIFDVLSSRWIFLGRERAGVVFVRYNSWVSYAWCVQSDMLGLCRFGGRRVLAHRARCADGYRKKEKDNCSVHMYFLCCGVFFFCWKGGFCNAHYPPKGLGEMTPKRDYAEGLFRCFGGGVEWDTRVRVQVFVVQFWWFSVMYEVLFS